MRMSSAYNAHAHSYSFVKIDLSEPWHEKLLIRAHDEVYVPSFPIEEERDPLELWLKRLRENPENSEYRYAIFIAGDCLDTPEESVLKGISVGIYYREAQAGLMAYNAIAPSARGNGLGRLMVGLRQDAFETMAADTNQTLNAVYVEINDSEKIDAKDDIYDPRKRERLFKSWGAVHIPIEYVQKNGFDGLKLMFYPDPKRQTPSFGDVEKFINVMHPGEKGEPHRRSITSLYNLAAQMGVSRTNFGRSPVVIWPSCHIG
jgi:hypothetical protein